MKTITLGRDRDTGDRVELPVAAFATHLHVPGATGKGKSTAVFGMLKQLLLDWRHPHCHVVVDFLGGLAHDLLLWMSTDRCTDQVRDRLVLFRPSDRRASLTLNPLLYDDLDQSFFKTNRASELILRAWSAQGLGDQPRLARWLHNALSACGQLGLTIADSEHLLLPGSPYHAPMMAALPDLLRAEWLDVITARGGEASRILDSTRNRMKPFFASGILRRIFGSVRNRLDAGRFMREGKILVLDLSPGGRLSPHEADAIAGLVVNEFMAAARSSPRHDRHPTYLWLDEFQRMVTPDFEYAIPEMRQLGVRLILAHQSFSQLKTPTTDLTSLIWQPQTRLVFGEQGEDAELLAQELASLTYDAKWVKEELYTLRQFQRGHDKVVLSSWAEGMTASDGWGRTRGSTAARNEGDSRRPYDSDSLTRNRGRSTADKEDESESGTRGRTTTESRHEQLVARLEDVRELSSRQFYTFEEQRNLWAQRVRKLHTGVCVTRVVNDDAIRTVQIDDPKTGVLVHDPATLAARFPDVLDRYEKLIEDNYAREFFASPAAIELEIADRLKKLLNPTLVVTTPLAPAPAATPAGPNPFAD